MLIVLDDLDREPIHLWLLRVFGLMGSCGPDVRCFGTWHFHAQADIEVRTLIIADIGLIATGLLPDFREYLLSLIQLLLRVVR